MIKRQAPNRRVQKYVLATVYCHTVDSYNRHKTLAVSLSHCSQD